MLPGRSASSGSLGHRGSSAESGTRVPCSRVERASRRCASNTLRGAIFASCVTATLTRHPGSHIKPVAHPLSFSLSGDERHHASVSRPCRSPGAPEAGQSRANGRRAGVRPLRSARPEPAPDLGRNAVGAREKSVFERRRVGHRALGRCDAPGVVEIAEPFFRHARDTSPAHPPVSGPSSTTTIRFVFTTEASTVGMSSGRSVLRSMTSDEMPVCDKDVSRLQRTRGRRSSRRRS